EERADAELAKEGVAAENRCVQRWADMRYEGQAYDITVPIASALSRRDDLNTNCTQFHAIHEKTYGHSSPNDPVQFVNYRVTALGLIPRPTFAEHVAVPNEPRPTSHRRV